MKNKTTIITERADGRMVCRTLLLTAFKNRGEFTMREEDDLRKRVYPKLIADATMTMRTQNTLGESIQLFDYYAMEELNFGQRLRHRLRMIGTAIKDYVGISTVVVVVEN